MLKTIISKLTDKQNLTEEEMIQAMKIIMDGQAKDSQVGGFLTALRMKGETIEEITGGAKVMRALSTKVDIDSELALDTCGTGGDKANTFNISTIVAIVAASAGVKVVKHGNRSVSSKCGSADVLESLGINIELKSDDVKKCVEEINIGFMFAPYFHSAMKNVIMQRRELGVRTVFNVLGPLTNPAMVKRQVLGIFDESLTEPIAEVLKNLGVEHAMVVHGMDGLDEITITTKTKVTELKNNQITTYYIDPTEYGFTLGVAKDILGGDPSENADIITSILSGEITGPMKDIVILNAGAAIYVGGVADSLVDGIKKAKEALEEGFALDKLNQFITLSQRLG